MMGLVANETDDVGNGVGDWWVTDALMAFSIVGSRISATN